MNPATEKPSIRTLSFIEKGLLGFEDILEYVLSPHDDESPFYTLTARQDPSVSFFVIEPQVIIEDYSFDLPDEEAQRLGIQSPEEVFVLLLLTIPENYLDMTANLLGPLVFHRSSNRGTQLVLDQKHYPLRFPVFSTPQAEEAPC